MTRDPVDGRWPVLGAVLCVGALASLHAWSLLRFPLPFVDEAWFASRAWALVSGQTFSSLDQGVVDGFPHAWFFFPLIPNLVYAAALAMAGSPALAAVRVVSFVGGAVLAIAVWRCARVAGGTAAAWTAVGLLATSATFFVSAHLARYDVLSAALAYVGASVYLNRRSGARLPMLVSSLCIGLGLEMHPFGAIVLVALSCVLVFDWWGGRADGRDGLVFAGGGVIAAVAWLSVHVLPDVRSLVALNAVIYGPTHVPTGGGSLSEAAGGLRETMRLLGSTYVAMTPLVILGLVFNLASGDWRKRRAAIMASAAVVAFVVLIRNRSTLYLIHVTPALDVCTGMLVVQLQQWWRLHRERALAAGTLAAVLVAHTVTGNILYVARNRWPVFERVSARLARSIVPGDTIIGAQTYWFGLTGHRYYSWEQLVYLRRYKALSTGAALEELRPTILIRDGHWDRFILDAPGTTLYQRLLTVPRAELESWLRTHATLQDQFDGEGYGQLRVYRIEWPSRPLTRGAPQISSPVTEP